MDLFEFLKDKLGCIYISDLTYEPYSTYVKSIMTALNIEEYALEQLTDLAQYIYKYNKVFENMNEAKDYFITHGKMFPPYTGGDSIPDVRSG